VPPGKPPAENPGELIEGPHRDTGSIGPATIGGFLSPRTYRPRRWQIPRVRSRAPPPSERPCRSGWDLLARYQSECGTHRTRSPGRPCDIENPNPVGVSPGGARIRIEHAPDVYARGPLAACPPMMIASKPTTTPDHWRNPNSEASPMPITSAKAAINIRIAPATTTMMPNALRDNAGSSSPSI